MSDKDKGVVAFAFGIPYTDPSNEQIARIASWKAHELHAPVYTQLDVRIETGVDVTYTTEEPGKPPQTLRIARGAVEWAVRAGFSELWIVAAKPHLWRALRDMERAVRESKNRIVIHTCTEIEEHPEDSWFSPSSGQKHTRSRKAWNRRENILRILPFVVYKRVAK